VEWYFENGQLASKSTVKSGELHGPHETYEPSDSLVLELSDKGTFKCPPPFGPAFPPAIK